MSSRHLNARQLRAIEKLGDAMVPGDSELPSFSSSGCVRHVDRLLDHMPASDLKDLGTLLTLLAFFPGFMLALFLKLLEWSPRLPGPLGSLLRMMRLGLRGLIVSLYWGDEGSLRAIDYRVGVFEGDRKT